MHSVNHQFLEFSDSVVKRYTKARLQPLTGYRLNPRNAVNPNERLEFLLATPEDNVEYIAYSEGKPTSVKQVQFTYDEEVLELYSELEVRSFERMNKLLIENGFLIEYTENTPAINTVNTLSDVELRKIAKLKMITAFTARVQELTSVYTLESLLQVMDTMDTVTNAQTRIVKDRISELK